MEKDPVAAPSPDAADASLPHRPAIEFKGMSHPALRAILGSPSIAAVRAGIQTLLRGGESGFEWEPVVIDAASFHSEAGTDLPELLGLLRALKLHPVAIAGAPETLRAQAVELELGWLAPIREVARRTPQPESPKPSEPAPVSPPAPPRPIETMTVDRPVRSGQQVYARGGDLIVIGQVSPGAEVIADGNIHIYGTLAGRAIAGAMGRRDVAIFTQDLRAELVAVSGIYRTFDDGVPGQHRGRPVRIELGTQTDTLSIRPL